MLPWQLSENPCFKSGYYFVLTSSCKETAYYSDSYCANNWKKAITHRRELGWSDTYLEVGRALGNTAHPSRYSVHIHLIHIAKIQPKSLSVSIQNFNSKCHLPLLFNTLVMTCPNQAPQPMSFSSHCF